MTGAQTVNMGQHGADARGLWRKAFPAQKRVEPDKTTTRQMQTFHLAREGAAVVAVQPIGDEQDHRPLPQDTARPVTVEGGE